MRTISNIYISDLSFRTTCNCFCNNYCKDNIIDSSKRRVIFSDYIITKKLIRSKSDGDLFLKKNNKLNFYKPSYNNIYRTVYNSYMGNNHLNLL